MADMMKAMGRQGQRLRHDALDDGHAVASKMGLRLMGGGMPDLSMDPKQLEALQKQAAGPA
jgi:hypothetical protein